MPVTRVIEQDQDEGEINSAWQRTYTRVFTVETDHNYDGPLVAREAPGIPQIGDAYASRDNHETDDLSFVTSVKAKRRKRRSPAGSFFDVTVSYGPYDATPFPENPLEWPIRLAWGGAQFERVLWIDLQGNPIVNSAGVRFLDPVTIDDSRPVLTITRNEPAYDINVALSYADKVNSDTFMTAPPGKVKVAFAPGELLFNPIAGFYWKVDYTYHFNRDGWKRKILDSGFTQLDGSSPPKLKTILDVKGQPLSDPANLDGSGGQLPSTDPPVFLEFDVYDTLNFATAFGFDFTGIPGF